MEKLLDVEAKIKLNDDITSYTNPINDLSEQMNLISTKGLTRNLINSHDIPNSANIFFKDGSQNHLVLQLSISIQSDKNSHKTKPYPLHLGNILKDYNFFSKTWNLSALYLYFKQTLTVRLSSGEIWLSYRLYSQVQRGLCNINFHCHMATVDRKGLNESVCNSK